MPFVTGNKDVSSANTLPLEERLVARSLIEIKSNNRPRMDPWGAPAVTFT